MEQVELDALLQQARAGERLAKAVEDLEGDVADIKPAVKELAAWLKAEKEAIINARAKGPIGLLFEDARFRTVFTAIIAAVGTAFANWMMAEYGVNVLASAPPASPVSVTVSAPPAEAPRAPSQRKE